MIDPFDIAIKEYPKEYHNELTLYSKMTGDEFGKDTNLIPNNPKWKYGYSNDTNGKIIRSLMLLGTGGTTCIHQKCDNNLYICVGDSIYKIFIPELLVDWKVQVDEATAFQITKMRDDLIVHGELSISCLNQDGEIIWQNYVSDIFVTEPGDNEFRIVNNKIYNFDGST